MKKPIAPSYIMICKYMTTDTPVIYYLDDDLAVEMAKHRVIKGKGGKGLMSITVTEIIEKEDFI
jgi:hypothetical protein